MLFNSYVFICVFLPVVLAGYYGIGRSAGHRPAVLWLVLASLLYYGWWNPAYLALIVGSMVVNYGFGRAIGGHIGNIPGLRKPALLVGVLFNLGLLGYYKYANFFVDNLNRVAGTSLHLETIVLPLAISFFTFQQIAYLVDVYRGGHLERDPLNFALFVTYFPQLIAGPIVHHGEMLPQFANPRLQRFNVAFFSAGLTVFVLGLFKKVVIADSVALWATPVFEAAARGESLQFYEAWGGALAYTLQLYHDFSGYSDMAVGLGLMFGIRLPVNFNSPYKATSIVDFWRRWHMTLSRFLRDYLYFPLGGNRRGTARRYVNLMLTMLLGGLWHGAGWTFVVWGGLHGLYLLINHAWRRVRTSLGWAEGAQSRWGRALAIALTFVAVVVGWVVFRATSFPAALQVLEGMAGLNGAGRFGRGAFGWLLIFLLWHAFRAPNTLVWVLGHTGREEIAQPRDDALPQPWRWRPSLRWGVAMACIAVISLMLLKGVGFQESEFLYYQF